MGTFHNFADLKNHADKEVKFKQNVLTRAAYNKGLIDPSHFLIVNGGQCAALSMAWLAQMILPAAGGVAFRRSDGVASGEDTESIATAAFTAPRQVTLQENFPNHGKIAVMKQLAKSNGLKLDLGWFGGKEKQKNSLLELVQKFKSSLGRGKGVFIDFYVDNDCHSVAMYRDLAKRFHFFDSNVGAYRIYDGHFDQFFNEYLRVLIYDLHWDLDPYAIGYPVKA